MWWMVTAALLLCLGSSKATSSPWWTLAAATHIRGFSAIFVFVAFIPKGMALKCAAPTPCFSCNSLKVRFCSRMFQMRRKQKFAWKNKDGACQRCSAHQGRLCYGLCLNTLKMKPCRQQPHWRMNQPEMHSVIPGNHENSPAKNHTLQNFKDAHFKLSSWSGTLLCPDKAQVWALLDRGSSSVPGWNLAFRKWR